jgi:cytochrome c peroxidase
VRELSSAARGFADGLRVPRSLDPATPLSRNTPTLLYAAPQASFLWDGRLATAWTQALRVLHAKAEMGIGPEALERRLKADDGYRAAFAEAFPDGVSAENTGRALGAYEDAELVPATAPIDRFARGDRGALDERMRAGFDVLAGVGRCTRCHVPPLFGGTRPPISRCDLHASGRRRRQWARARPDLGAAG